MFVRFEDSTPDDEDIDELSDAAFRLWFNAICYSQRAQSDGRVPAARLARLKHGYRKALLDELTRQPDDPDRDPILKAVAGGYQIRNFTRYNRTAAYWRAEAEKASTRKKRWQEKKQTEPKEGDDDQ